ncbi:MAG: class I SAM-dependent methyltransferase [Candidatus Kaistia colombiensis]|nr:MAG: class I SAM-dependent methyltransferase [Kaistia sp.]
MSTPSKSEHWDAVYGSKTETEVSWFEVVPQRSLDWIAHSGVGKADPILDVGGGISRLPDHLVAAGFADVSVIDLSAEAIQRVLARLGPSAPVHGIVGDITTWRPDRRYRLWHDRAVLHFLVDDEDRQAYRRTLLAALEPGGQAIIATFAPTGPERCSGLPVRRYGKTDLEAFLGDEFAPLESDEFDHVTPAGRVQRFHVGRFRRGG